MSGYVSKKIQANRKTGLDGGGFKKSGSGGGVGMPPMLRRFATSRAPAVREEIIGGVSKPVFAFGLTSSTITEETIGRVGFITVDGIINTSNNPAKGKYLFNYSLMTNTNNFEIVGNTTSGYELKTKNANIQDGTQSVQVKAVSTPDNFEYITTFDIQIVNPVFTFVLSSSTINERTIGSVGFITAHGNVNDLLKYSFNYSVITNTNNFEIVGNTTSGYELKTKNANIQDGTQSVQIKAVSTPGNNEYNTTFNIQIKPVFAFGLTSSTINERTIGRVGFITVDGNTNGLVRGKYSFGYSVITNTNNFEIVGNTTSGYELKTKNANIQDGTQSVQIKAVSTPDNFEYITTFDIQIKPVFAFGLTSSTINEQTIGSVGFITVDGNTNGLVRGKYSFGYSLMSNTNNFEIVGNTTSGYELKTKNANIQDGTQSVQIKAVSTPDNFEYITTFDIQIKPVFAFGLTSSTITEETIGRVGFITVDGNTNGLVRGKYSFGYSVITNTNNFEIVGNTTSGYELKTKNANIQDGTQSVQVKAVSTPGNNEYNITFNIQIVNTSFLKQKTITTDITSFGYSVSMSSTGNSVIVGTYDQNKAYIYSSSDNWTTPIVLSQLSGLFGFSVSMSSNGNSVIVGAYDQNKAYIYSSSDNWTTPIVLSQSSGYFGYSVSMSSTGNSVIVGAFGGNTNKAYIYSSSDNWTTPIVLSQSSGYFGYSVSMSSTGNSVVVGAYSQNKAYIYSSSDNWTTPIVLSQSSGEFGYSVSMSSTGNSVIVGTYDQNKAYIYSSSDNWTTPIVLSQSSGRFGFSVSMSSTGNSVIVGAYIERKAYIYSSSDNWTTPIELSQSSSGQFGRSVSMSETGNSVIVGASEKKEVYIYSQ